MEVQERIEVPQAVTALLEKLNREGFGAWCVGGCVRDSMMGKKPHDWDITSSASVGQMQQIFSDKRVLLTGAAHGTVTIVTEIGPIEVTTYRTDGEYLDHRRPNGVFFTDNLHEDLKRRDFTVNAMAYHPRFGLVDDFGGRDDLKNRCLRAVGEAVVRFEEDALRILRAMRFASVLGFEIEEKTARALFEKKDDLSYIAGERIEQELSKMAAGDSAGSVIERYRPVIESALGGRFEKPLPVSWPKQREEALAALLFLLSREQAEKVEKRFHLSNVQKRVLWDVFDMAENPSGRTLPRTIIDMTPCGVLTALSVLRCFDEKWQTVLDETQRLLAQNDCWRVRDLALDGTALLANGLSGRQISLTLEQLLLAVAEGRCENKADRLTEYMKRVLL